MGKHINELRRKATDKYLASRAKNLVKRWRKLLVNPDVPVVVANNHSSSANNSIHRSPPLASSTVIPSGATSNTVNKSSSQAKSTPASAATTAPSSAVSSPRFNSSIKAPVVNNNHPKSLPSSTSSSPGLSRPVTPSQQTSLASSNNSRPVSPYNESSSVSRTLASNKRLRKAEDEGDVEEPPSKKPMTNGYGHADSNSDFLLDGDTRDSFLSTASNTCDSVISKVPNNLDRNPPPTSKPPPTPTPARRSTRSQSRKSVVPPKPDVLEQQMLSVRKVAGKVRTTQEIVQELALRSHSPGLITRNANGGGGDVDSGVNEDGLAASETKIELMNRFFDSQTNYDTSNGTSPPLSALPSPTSMRSESMPVSPEEVDVTANGDQEMSEERPETVEEIMAKLPVINASEVLAEMNAEMVDDDDEEELEEVAGLIPAKPANEIEVTPELVDGLHDRPMANFNGNFDHKGDFKEWHEVLTKETLGGELLYVLPYSVIE